MADPILERDLQELKDLEVLSRAGDESAQQRLFFLCSDIVKRATKWQWIIHGDTLVYRQRCVRWLIRQQRFTQARRFAMCGRGDVALLGDTAGSVRIKPKGCGARFCPRCSRRYGRRFLSRVCGHLSSGPHGELWHIVFTQRVIPTETLLEARERFAKAWKRMYGVLRRMGMVSALATYHVTPSSVKGWHFHCHVVAELGDGVSGEACYKEWDDAWFSFLGDGESQRKPLFVRQVSTAGAALEGLKGERQMEFWNESVSQAEVLLQYVLRDILQGVEGWIAKMSTDEACEQFAGALAGAKLHRLYGVWRTKLVDEDKDDEADASGQETASGGVLDGAKGVTLWHSVGTMDEVLWWARQLRAEGMEVVRRLCARSSNRGAVALRLLTLAREFAG